MEMYHVPEHRANENYMIQGMEPSLQFTSPFEQVGPMYNEGATGFFVDQGLFYPAATSYGYYCTGFESPSEWEEHQRGFAVDCPEIQYSGAQNESLPYVYYTPTYGYSQSPYNPYNPYIPGAMIGVDCPFVEAQQYYSVPPYQGSSSPAYIPAVLQPNVIPSSSSETPFATGTSITRPDGRGSKNNVNSSSVPLTNSKKPISNTKNPLSMISEGSKASVGPSNQAVTRGSNTNGGLHSPASSHVLQDRNSFGSIQPIDNLPNAKFPSQHNQLKVSIPSSGGFSDFGTHNQAQVTLAKLRPSIQVGSSLDDINNNSLVDQNYSQRVNRSKNELAVKAYTTSTGGTNNVQGNVIIYTDQFNKDNFQVEYTDAKFFVIKSYSEDDVHKSIKYNVWSSTPNGNKKLSCAFEDAQRVAARKAGGCPIFLFFSVNMSGQFCGVAEMIGPVDFSRDMDFWQQDKWSGSFPVKWHIIKDVPNTSLRHIILENNENKPVTNSRDTQEIMYKNGIEMLKLFKSYRLKSSLLDDFMFYEHRQKMLQEEKARSLVRSFESPLFVPAVGPPRKLNYVVEQPRTRVENANKLDNEEINYTKAIRCTTEQVSSQTKMTKVKDEQSGVEAKDYVSTLNMSAVGTSVGTLSINPKHGDYISAVGTCVAHTEGSMDVKAPPKINGSTEETSGFLTIGTIPLDPKALSLEKGGAVAKKGPQQK